MGRKDRGEGAGWDNPPATRRFGTGTLGGTSGPRDFRGEVQTATGKEGRGGCFIMATPLRPHRLQNREAKTGTWRRQ